MMITRDIIFNPTIRQAMKCRSVLAGLIITKANTHSRMLGYMLQLCRAHLTTGFCLN